MVRDKPSRAGKSLVKPKDDAAHPPPAIAAAHAYFIFRQRSFACRNESKKKETLDDFVKTLEGSAEYVACLADAILTGDVILSTTARRRLQNIIDGDATPRRQEALLKARLITKIGGFWGTTVASRLLTRKRHSLESIWSLAKLQPAWLDACRVLNGVMLFRHEAVLIGESRKGQAIGTTKHAAGFEDSDVKHAIQFIEEGLVKIGKLEMPTLPEMDDNIKQWTTLRAEDIVLPNGKCSVLPALLVQFDSDGILEREASDGTVHRKPRAEVSLPKRRLMDIEPRIGTKRPHEDDSACPHNKRQKKDTAEQAAMEDESQDDSGATSHNHEPEKPPISPSAQKKNTPRQDLLQENEMMENDSLEDQTLDDEALEDQQQGEQQQGEQQQGEQQQGEQQQEDQQQEDQQHGDHLRQNGLLQEQLLREHLLQNQLLQDQEPEGEPQHSPLNCPTPGGSDLTSPDSNSPMPEGPAARKSPTPTPPPTDPPTPGGFQPSSTRSHCSAPSIQNGEKPRRDSPEYDLRGAILQKSDALASSTLGRAAQQTTSNCPATRELDKYSSRPLETSTILSSSELPASATCPICQGTCQAGFLAENIPNPDSAFAELHKIHDLVLRTQELGYCKSKTAQTCFTNIRMATIYYDPADLGQQTATREEAELWCLSLERFWELLDEQHVFRKPILILNDGTLARYTIEGCMKTLQDHLDMLIEASKLPGSNVTTKIAMLLPDSRVPQLVEISKVMEHLDIPCTNALDMHPFIEASIPEVLHHGRLTILRELVKSDTYLAAGKGQGHSHHTIQGCESFNIAAMQGAVSGTHSDLFVGTYLRCLDGEKLWAFIPDHLRTDVVAGSDFVQAGDEWDPQGCLRGVVLRKGNLFFMPPSRHPIIHSVLSMEKSVMHGGMYWDTLMVDEIMEAMLFTAHNPSVSNEAWPDNLQSIFRKLDSLVRKDPARFSAAADSEAFLEKWSQLYQQMKELPCSCGTQGWDDCSTNPECPCQNAGRRCTNECGEHFEQACLQEGAGLEDAEGEEEDY